MIETPRLILREIRLEDAPALGAYRDHQGYAEYITTEPDPDYDIAASILKKLARAEQQPKRYWPFVVVLKEENKVIGDLRIYTNENFFTICELAYGINPEYWGQGYMSEAVKAVIDFCHDELKMHRIIIRMDARNTGSVKVAEKSGLQLEGASRYEFKMWKGFVPELRTYSSVRPELIPAE